MTLLMIKCFQVLVYNSSISVVFRLPGIIHLLIFGLCILMSIVYSTTNNGSEFFDSINECVTIRGRIISGGSVECDNLNGDQKLSF